MSFIKDKITVIHHLCSVIGILEHELERQPTNRVYFEILHSFVDENDKTIHSGTLCSTTIQDNYNVINKTESSDRM